MKDNEAIKWMKEAIQDCTSGEDKIYKEAFGMAILALENKTPNELDIIENFIHAMPKTYRARNHNHVVVRDILLRKTSTAGMTSCVMKCYELGIDPYGYALEAVK